MRLYSVASIVNAGAALSLLPNSGPFAAAVTDDGVGNVSPALQAGMGLAADESVFLTTPRGALAASGLRSVGVAHTSATAKQFTSNTEGGAGAASAAADFGIDCAVLELFGGLRDRCEILCAGSVAFAVGAPSFVWQSGAFQAAIADTGDGDINLVLQAGHGIDADEAVWLATPRVTLAASGLRSISFAHTDDVTKRVTLLTEGGAGAASAPADTNFDFVCIGARAPIGRRYGRQLHRSGVRLVAACSVDGAGAFLWQSGAFASSAAAGAGLVDLTLQADQGYDATQCAIIASPRGALAASGNRAIGLVHTSDTVKRVTLLTEGGGGAASALATAAFDLAIFAKTA